MLQNGASTLHNGLIISAITKTADWMGRENGKEHKRPGTGKKGSGDAKTGKRSSEAKAPGGIRALDAATKGCGNVIKD